MDSKLKRGQRELITPRGRLSGEPRQGTVADAIDMMEPKIQSRGV